MVQHWEGVKGDWPEVLVAHLEEVKAWVGEQQVLGEERLEEPNHPIVRRRSYRSRGERSHQRSFCDGLPQVASCSGVSCTSSCALGEQVLRLQEVLKEEEPLVVLKEEPLGVLREVLFEAWLEVPLEVPWVVPLSQAEE